MLKQTLRFIKKCHPSFVRHFQFLNSFYVKRCIFVAETLENGTKSTVFEVFLRESGDFLAKTLQS
jgi:hypothetical protein